MSVIAGVVVALVTSLLVLVLLWMSGFALVPGSPVAFFMMFTSIASGIIFWFGMLEPVSTMAIVATALVGIVVGFGGFYIYFFFFPVIFPGRGSMLTLVMMPIIPCLLLATFVAIFEPKLPIGT